MSDILFTAGNIEDRIMTEALLEVHLNHHSINTDHHEEENPYDRIAYPTFNSFLYRESLGSRWTITVRSPASGEILYENLDGEIKKFTTRYNLDDILLSFGLHQYQLYQAIAIKMTPSQTHQIRMPVLAKPVAAYSMLPKDWHLLSPIATVHTFATLQDDIIMIIVSKEYMNSINRKSNIRGNTLEYEEGEPLSEGTLTGSVLPEGEAIVILLVPPESSLHDFRKKKLITTGDAVAELIPDEKQRLF